MNEQETRQALAEIESKYNALLETATEQIRLLKALCDEQDRLLTERVALIDAYRKYRELQEAKTQQLITVLEYIHPFTFAHDNIVTTRKALAKIRDAINLALTPDE